jgi:hypothetical protein
MHLTGLNGAFAAHAALRAAITPTGKGTGARAPPPGRYFDLAVSSTGSPVLWCARWALPCAMTPETFIGSDHALEPELQRD